MNVRIIYFYQKRDPWVKQALRSRSPLRVCMPIIATIRVDGTGGKMEDLNFGQSCPPSPTVGVISVFTELAPHLNNLFCPRKAIRPWRGWSYSPTLLLDNLAKSSEAHISALGLKRVLIMKLITDEPRTFHLSSKVTVIFNSKLGGGAASLAAVAKHVKQLFFRAFAVLAFYLQLPALTSQGYNAGTETKRTTVLGNVMYYNVCRFCSRAQ